MGNARQRLNDLCGKLRLQPKHDTQQLGSKPAPTADGASHAKHTAASWKASVTVMGLTFEGTGANKKAAQEVAAEKAAEYLQQYMEAQQQAAGGAPAGSAGSGDAPDLAEVLVAILQASKREPFFHVLYQQAVEEGEGWVPLSLLLRCTKAMRKWMRTHGARQCQELGLPDPEGADHVTQVTLLARALRAKQEQQEQEKEQQPVEARPGLGASDAAAPDPAAPAPEPAGTASEPAAPPLPTAAAPATQAVISTGGGDACAAVPMDTDAALSATTTATGPPPGKAAAPRATPQLWRVEQCGLAVRLVPSPSPGRAGPSLVVHEVQGACQLPSVLPGEDGHSADAHTSGARARAGVGAHTGEACGTGGARLVPAVLLMAHSADSPGSCAQLVHLRTGGHFLGQVAHMLASASNPKAAASAMAPPGNEADGASPVPTPAPAAAPPTTGLAPSEAARECGRLVAFDATGCKWMRVNPHPPANADARPPTAGTDAHAAADTTEPVGNEKGATGAEGAEEAGQGHLHSAASEAGTVELASEVAGASTVTSGRGGAGAGPPAAVALEQVDAPFMYGLVPESTVAQVLRGGSTDAGGLAGAGTGEGTGNDVNVLASWLAGHIVHGHVLLTLSRPRNRANEARRPVLHWSGFDLTDLVLALGALTPSVRLCTMRKAPLATQLPTAFTTHSAWQGNCPRNLLAQYCERQLGWQTFGGAAAAAPVYQRLTWEEAAPDGTIGGAAAAATPAGAKAAAENAMVVDGCAALTAGARARGQDAPGAAAEEEEEEDLGRDWEAGEARMPVGMVVLELQASALGGRPANAGALRAEEEVSRDHPNMWDVAENRVALRMLRALHDLDGRAARRLLLGAGHAAASCDTTPGAGLPAAPWLLAPGPSGASEEKNEEERCGEEEGWGLVVLHEGDLQHRRVRPGTMPLVNYQLWLHLPEGTSTPSPASSASAASGPGSGSGGALKRLRDEPEQGAEGAEGSGAMDIDQEQRQGSRKAQEATQPLLVESGHRLPFQVGCASVVPQMEAAVWKLHVRGSAQCRLAVPMAGPDPFGLLPRMRGTLLVTLAGVQTPALAPGGSGLSHFSRPLNALRTELVLQLCQERGATAICDLGCGSCEALMAIIRTPARWGGQLLRYVGLDVSKNSLSAAGRKLARLLGDTVEPPPPSRAIKGATTSDAGVEGTPVVFRCEAALAVGVPACELRACNVLQSSLANEPVAWGDLVGVDAAIMEEVVEHLDPEPLSKVGACLLGGLQPRLFIMTTPNWEYNAVMRLADARAREDLGLGGSPVWPGPPGRDGQPLRCADHRFEWTREEFATWARGVAEEHGYSVSFTGAGKVNCAHPEVLQASEAAEFATQVAMFERVAP